MTKQEHIDTHVRLHSALDELVADYLAHTKGLIGDLTVWELIRWSHKQTKNPTEPGDDEAAEKMDAITDTFGSEKDD